MWITIWILFLHLREFLILWALHDPEVAQRTPCLFLTKLLLLFEYNQIKYSNRGMMISTVWK
jgi:hypothetical protein